MTRFIRSRPVSWRQYRNWFTAEDKSPPSHAWRSPAPAPGTNGELEVWLALRPPNALGLAIRMAARFGHLLSYIDGRGRDGGWRVLDDGKWLTREASKFRVQQFAIKTVSALEYEWRALRVVGFDGAARLALGLDEAARRAGRRYLASFPGEHMSEDEMFQQYIRRLVVDLQLLQSRCRPASGYFAWKPTATLRLARALLPPLPQWEDQMRMGCAR